jgi:phospholipid/cholesterol/gamma-HCH transport system substrate-binding protein
MQQSSRALSAGLFTVILLAASIGLFYWLGHLDRERNAYVVSTQASVTGLNPESTVFYRGIAVGKVLSIAFDPENSDTILIRIEVDKNIVLTQGVFATLKLKGVTGLTQLELEELPEKPKDLKALSPGNRQENRIPLLPSQTDRLLNEGDALLKKADHLMLRLNALLTDENEKHIVDILANLSVLSGKLQSLQQRVDNALAEVPGITKDARHTLKNIDSLAADLKDLSKQARTLSKNFNATALTATSAGNTLNETTLPKINKLLNELQDTSEQVKKIAVTLQNNPREVWSVVEQTEPGPGEPGYQEPK